MDNLPEENEEILEAAAAETLKPGGGSGGGQTRAEMLATFTSLMNQLGKEDFSHWFNDSIAKIGKEGDAVPSGAAAKNKASISMKEDLDEVFSEDETLSEEFKEKASTIFESIVEARVNLEVSKLQEEFEALEEELVEKYNEALEEESAEIFEDVTEKLNSYLDHIVETWLEENKLAVENSIRLEIAENFMESLKNVFAEHYVEVPEERFDIIGEMKAQIEELTEKLNESLDKNIELEEAVNEATKNTIIDEASEDLAETQVEKLKSLTEGLEFVDADTFAKKVAIIKESHFNKKSTKVDTGLITEEIDGSEDGSKDEVVSPGMNHYVQAISKTIK